jgi:hypothetical protein
MNVRLPRLPFAVDPLMAEAKRRARQRRLLVAAVAVLLVGGGAAGTMAALRSGSGVTPAAKGVDVAQIEREWHAGLREGARSNPGERFPSPSKAVLLRRLRLAASRYHFTVVTVQIAHPLQAAPFVVVQTADEQALSHATPAILQLLDPDTAKRGSDDRSGHAYEGFLFEARDTNGVPFLATDNWWRSRTDAGGGQAASSEQLYPFAHG